MIDRDHRFHGYNSLSYAYRRGEVVHGQITTVRFVRNPKRQTYRAAVVVSKKVSKSAVVRNRIRRRVYEIVRLNVPEAANYDIIINVFSDSLATMPSDKLVETIVGQLRQAGITK